jgi:hypothetical protein
VGPRTSLDDVERRKISLKNICYLYWLLVIVKSILDESVLQNLNNYAMYKGWARNPALAPLPSMIYCA